MGEKTYLVPHIGAAFWFVAAILFIPVGMESCFYILVPDKPASRFFLNPWLFGCGTVACCSYFLVAVWRLTRRQLGEKERKRQAGWLEPMRAGALTSGLCMFIVKLAFAWSAGEEILLQEDRGVLLAIGAFMPAAACLATGIATAWLLYYDSAGKRWRLPAVAAEDGFAWLHLYIALLMPVFLPVFYDTFTNIFLIMRKPWTEEQFRVAATAAGGAMALAFCTSLASVIVRMLFKMRGVENFQFPKRVNR